MAKDIRPYIQSVACLPSHARYSKRFAWHVPPTAAPTSMMFSIVGMSPA